ncbi:MULTISPECIES: GntR family transcriptional regulator [Afipia]|jgi:DNA-binding GntR family transcriptional regulator|uniref:DNA-binding GntR family transcriptional regulator n=1 Tax=Afipia massiliensis TaxID=211460 RepID=A0A840N4N3_9BRAD|nr:MULTISPECIES: GntR family transcriptional regulator [Afipia]MBB5053584.1 DNA-binding GntR family transcriptional regulator [Afipia massiliensis]WIG52213.1 MAG: Transcriptional regulator, GntR family [Afipia sp.]
MLRKHHVQKRQKPFAADEDDPNISLADHAYRALEEMIVTLRLQPGAALSEQTLASQLGMGRTPIREALRRLEREGLVLILPRRGVLVSELNVHKQLSLLEMRRETERLLARLSAERASPEQRKEFAHIGSNLRQLTEDTDETLFSRWDNRLTELEYEASQNEFAAKSMALLHGLSRRFWIKYHRRHASLVDTAVLHANLAEQICRGNAKSAAAASDKLLDYIEDFTRNTIV